MFLNMLLAGVILFFINSCMIPIHFVGYQFRALKAEEGLEFSQHMAELGQPQYNHYISGSCSYYFHRRNAHYFTICQRDKDIYFVGTDVRSNDIHHLSGEEVITKLGREVSERVVKIKTVLGGLHPTKISDPSFTVYLSHELENE